jgi:hypothetical protein
MRGRVKSGVALVACLELEGLPLLRLRLSRGEVLHALLRLRQDDQLRTRGRTNAGMGDPRMAAAKRKYRRSHTSVTGSSGGAGEIKREVIQRTR